MTKKAFAFYLHPVDIDQFPTAIILAESAEVIAAGEDPSVKLEELDRDGEYSAIKRSWSLEYPSDLFKDPVPETSPYFDPEIPEHNMMYASPLLRKAGCKELLMKSPIADRSTVCFLDEYDATELP